LVARTVVIYDGAPARNANAERAAIQITRKLARWLPGLYFRSIHACFPAVLPRSTGRLQAIAMIKPEAKNRIHWTLVLSDT
jgi:hypothetical protein